MDDKRVDDSWHLGTGETGLGPSRTKELWINNLLIYLLICI